MSCLMKNSVMSLTKRYDKVLMENSMTPFLPVSRLLTSSGLRSLSTSSVRPSSEPELEVNIPMIRKMERICRSLSVWLLQNVVFNTSYHRNYIDQLDQPGGKHYNIQNFMMMYIFGSTTNTHYRTKLFDHWPTVSSHMLAGCM